MISEAEKNNILQCADKYKNMCINIDFLIEILLPPLINNFIAMTDLNQLRKGNYGKLLNCEIWVRKIENKCIQISNDNVQNYEDANWTPPILIKYANKIEKMLELKSFW